MITNYELEAYCFWQLSDKKGIGRLGFRWMLLQRCWYIKKSGEGEKFLKKKKGGLYDSACSLFRFRNASFMVPLDHGLTCKTET